MRILVTNDDGINALGLKILVAAAMKLGEVICIAPLYEQSGKSHCIVIKEPFLVDKCEDILPGVKTYTVDSTPADCVRVAQYYLNEHFDIVLSGINNGYNLGEDILYSGTVGAASEGVLCGKKAIAFSTARNNFDKLEEELNKIITYIIENELIEKHSLWNINIPINPKGVMYTSQGCTNFDAYYELVGKDLIFSRGGPDFAREKDKVGSDVCAVYNNYISITPLVVDRTSYDILKKINN